MSKEISLNFEEALKRIEEIVEILEKGDCSLDSSLELFEEAMGLCAFCNTKLEDAQNKINAFTQVVPFNLEASKEV